MIDIIGQTLLALLISTVILAAILGVALLIDRNS